MEGKQKNKKYTHIETLVLTMISCAMAPLIANWLDTVLGVDKNQWSSERLIVLFFSVLSGSVIWDKICRIYKDSKLNKIDFDITNARAQEQFIWTMPSLIVLMFYDSIFGATMSIIFFMVTVWIMWKDKAEIQFDKNTYTITLIYTIAVIFIDIKAPIKLHWTIWIKVMVFLFAVNIIIWIAIECYKRYKKGKDIYSED